MILFQRNRIWIFCISPSAKTNKYRIGDTRDRKQLIVSACSFTENNKLHPSHTGVSLVPFLLNCLLASRSGYQIFSHNFSVWKFKPFQSWSDFCFDHNWLTFVLTPTRASKKILCTYRRPLLRAAKCLMQAPKQSLPLLGLTGIFLSVLLRSKHLSNNLLRRTTGEHNNLNSLLLYWQLQLVKTLLFTGKRQMILIGEQCASWHLTLRWWHERLGTTKGELFSAGHRSMLSRIRRGSTSFGKTKRTRTAGPPDRTRPYRKQEQHTG